MVEVKIEKLFGTDGVRGTANIHPMTAEMAMSLGQALAHVFNLTGGQRHRVIIGKDTRVSGYMFESALTSGICSMGVDVLQVGPVPTPAMAFLTVDMRCDAGIMITASHNPYCDNGIKFFSRDGFKLPDNVEQRIEELIHHHRLQVCERPEHIGRAKRIDDVRGRYVVFAKQTFPKKLTLDGLRVVLDCGNGAGYKVAPTALKELGAEVFTLGVTPNGYNINLDCGSLHPEKIAAKVREVRADVGIALDGDADRVVMVDERGEVVDGDTILALCAQDMQRRGVLKGNSVVATVMSNLGLEKALTEMGLDLIRTQVGDRYVVEAMRDGGYNLGGEQSGHIVLLDHNATGDGLVTALQVLSIMRSQQKPLSELSQILTLYPQVLINVKVAAKPPIEEVPDIVEAIERVEKELGDKGRILLRYSGTESMLRVMVEGESKERVQSLADELAGIVQKALANYAG